MSRSLENALTTALSAFWAGQEPPDVNDAGLAEDLTPPLDDLLKATGGIHTAQQFGISSHELGEQLAATHTDALSDIAQTASMDELQQARRAMNVTLALADALGSVSPTGLAAGAASPPESKAILLLMMLTGPLRSYTKDIETLVDRLTST